MIGASPAVEAALARFEDRYPETIDLSLDRILALLDALGRPQNRLPPVIHVAGTNGKGSTSAFLRAMAEAAGLSVHAATSPHLVRFNERIRLAGRLVEDGPLIDWLKRTHSALGDGQITHFEATQAAAFLAFSEVPADLLILEVGLGGRFDATNVVEAPAVSVITPVDFDHKAYLGSDLGRIAWEKAGVIKRGRPVVSARQSEVPAHVIAEEAFALDAPLYQLSADDLAAISPPLALKGAHQIANAALAAKGLTVWGDTRITPYAIAEGAKSATWPARMQHLADGPVTRMASGVAEVWLDGGHNPHAARAIARLLSELGGETALVVAMMASKDARGFFAAFKALSPQVFACPNAEGRKGAGPEDLAAAARDAGLEATPVPSLRDGLAAAAARRPHRILICGSLYLAGEVLAENGEPPD